MKPASTIFVAATLTLVSACTTAPGNSRNELAAVQRLYVIECGENHAKDVSSWTTAPEDKGKPYVFSNNCYLIQHRNGWMLWDSGNADRIGTAGQVNPRGTLTAYMSKPLVASLKGIGLSPADIRYFAMSHSHGDHSGNANLFAGSKIYMQTAEYNAIRGPAPEKMGIPPANFKDLPEANIVKLNGDSRCVRRRVRDRQIDARPHTRSPVAVRAAATARPDPALRRHGAFKDELGR